MGAIKTIPIARTSLLENEVNAVLEPLKSGWLVQGPIVKEFEKKWSIFTDAPHSLAVTSCTAGLSLALAALDVGVGDEVILPAFTWVATANVVEQLGAKPVLCDIVPETFNIDTSLIESLITERTVGIIPVHLFGLSADMDPILNLAKKYGLWIVEDAACGFGSTYDDKHVGNFGDAGVFSFHPRKSITTGEGGMVTVSDKNLARKIQQLREHGAVTSDLQRHLGQQPYLLADHVYAGYNQRMTDIQAAIGRAQMDRAEEIVKERRQIASLYDDAFLEIDCLRTPYKNTRFGHGYQSYPCMLIFDGPVEEGNQRRNEWMKVLLHQGISTRPATHALHMLSFYKQKYGLLPDDFPNARLANDCSISLPLFHGMTEAEILTVVRIVRETAPS